MDGDLRELVWDRAAADVSLTEDAKLLIDSAMESDDAVASLLQSGGTTAAARPVPVAATGDATPVEPACVYLTEVTVEGFRGIGPRTTLPLPPGPGLIVVAGRNGSGKSSFAEAVEVAVSSASYRWSKRQKMYEKTWRNVHHASLSEVLVQMTEAGSGITTLSTSWAPDVADLSAASSWVQRAGQKRQPGTGSLGWRQALELYRPFLSHAELGDQLNTTPSALYDAIHSVLGLEQLSDALDRLDGLVKDLAADEKAANGLRTNLKTLLASAADDRAASALTELRKHVPDIDAVAALAVGGTQGPDHRPARLARISQLTVPALDIAEAAIARYRSATERLENARAGTDAESARRQCLLSQALAHHAEHGSGHCPVCGVGTLDDEWAKRVKAEIDHDNATARELTAAQREHDSAGQELARLSSAPPADLIAEAALAEPLVTAASALAAWRNWASLTSAESIADAGENALLELTDAVQALCGEAASEAERLHDSWQPIALKLAEWVPLARKAAAGKDQLRMAKSAYTWLRTNADDVRNARLEPLNTRAQQIWAALRQQSNVDLGAITLSGSKTSRRVELIATVDGTEAGALEVMSQGERNALALALFLPKVEMPGSPFGFVQIDDPVQAMDPAKVDGLALLLHDIAQRRQVIVFTHDDRLPEAIQRLELPATILGVTRSEESVVSVREQSDPVGSYLDDARVIARDDGLPDEVRRRVVPGLCRAALEHRCRELFYRRELRKGSSRRDIEARWAATVKTSKRLMLIVNQTGEPNLDRWLGHRTDRKTALGICSSAPHNGFNGSLTQAVKDVAAVVAELKAASHV